MAESNSDQIIKDRFWERSEEIMGAYEEELDFNEIIDAWREERERKV